MNVFSGKHCCENEMKSSLSMKHLKVAKQKLCFRVVDHRALKFFLRSLQTMCDPQNPLASPPPDRVKNDRSLKGSTMIDLDNGRTLMLLDVTVCPLIHFITQDKQPRRIRVKSKAMRNPYQDETKRMLPRIHQSRDIG